MALVIHILVALGSLVAASFLYFSPSKFRFRITYATTAAMLASGLYLVTSTNASMIHACAMGLFFLGIVAVLVIAAHKKVTVKS